MKRNNFFALCFILLLPLSSLFSNNIKVENARLTGQNTAERYTMIEFDISWDNSWRDIVNWDAAWVFVKYQGSNGIWKTAYLDVNDANHIAPVGSVINAGGSHFITSPYSVGVFIYRSSNGSGSNNWDKVQLRWNYSYQAIDDNALVTFKVFAIEMVYVPQGSFYLGDGSSTYHFYRYNYPTSPFNITSQGSITVGQSAENLWAMVKSQLELPIIIFPQGTMPFTV